MAWKFYNSNGRLLTDETAGANALADLSDVSAAAQTANFVLAAGDGSTGGDYRGRLLVAADVPSLNASKITAGALVLERGGTEADLSATGPGVIQQRTAGEAFTNLKYNFLATAAPTANDDSGDGYDEGSWWFDLTNDKAYVCLDASPTAAVWTELGSGSGATSLDGLTDVAITAAARGDILTRNATEFVNQNIGANEVVARVSGAVDVDGIAMGASTILARLAAGDIVAATVAQIKTLLAYAVADVTNAAHTALSNLAAVAINTSLISDTDNTDDLGSSAIKWREIFSNALTLEERVAPGTPAASDVVIYAKADGKVYSKDDAGNEYDLTSGGVGSGIATVQENAVNVVTSADTLDFKDANVEDLTGGNAGVYLDIPLICQGRLTLTTAVPVTTSDVTAATTLYYTPYLGSQISLFDGTRWKKYAFTERSIAIPATTNTNYDVFLYDNAGTLTLELVAWTNDTTRATALALQDGVYLKTGALTRRYLGTIRTTGVSGQCEDSTSRRLVWNNYHRVRRSLLAVDTTDNWSYTTATWRASNNSTTVGVARVELVIGVAENPVDASVLTSVQNNTVCNVASGIGLDSTSVNSALIYGAICNGPAPSFGYTIVTCEYLAVIGIGFHYLQQLEISQATGSTTWFGDAAITYKQAGMVGSVMG